MIRVLTLLICLITFGHSFSQSAKGGSVLYESIRSMAFEEREKLIESELKSGNIPDFMKNFVRIETIENDALGKLREVVLFISPNYLSAGNDDDFFIVPVGPLTAQRVADFYNCSLPTPKLVDIIYFTSVLKLEPFNYIPRGNRNESPDILYEHSKVIQAQIKASGNHPGVFVAGIKKDIVISSRLTDPNRPRHVTIYGWHKPDGKPIQPVNNVHINTYVDYSHGARLVSNRVLIDGKEYDYRDVLRDHVLHTLLSYEESPLSIISYINSAGNGY